MKRSRVLVIGAVLVAAGMFLWRESSAQPKPMPAATKVAVCDIVKLFTEYERNKDFKQKFVARERANKIEDERRTKEIDSIDKELQGLKPDSKEYDARLAELTRLGIDRETWIKYEKARDLRERMSAIESMHKEILAMVAAVAKDEGVQAVFASDDSPFDQTADIYRQVESRKALYVDGSIDMTDEVLKRLNRAYADKKAGKP
ncbi:MAG: OmpH family outer membrane protein [Phycisphaerae bacterium]